MSEQRVYTLEEIPAGVMTEITDYFKSVVTDQYSTGTIDENTRSYKTSYTERLSGNVVQMFTVRGNINPENGEFSLLQVAHSGILQFGETSNAL